MSEIRERTVVRPFRAILTTAVVVVTWLAISNGGAVAQESQPTACDPVDQAQITATISSDGQQATFTVGNANPLCAPVDIGFAAYTKDGPGFVTPQELFGTPATSTITSGSTTLTINLPQTSTEP